jgi:hypothetical protein
VKKDHRDAVIIKMRQQVKNRLIAMNVARVPMQEIAFAAPVEAD